MRLKFKKIIPGALGIILINFTKLKTSIKYFKF